MELTKQQERDALDQITAILEAAGPDSYIGMAFRGCVEIARQNIENDFGDSSADRADYLAAQLDRVTRQRDEMRRDIECSTRAMQAEMDGLKQDLEAMTKQRDDYARDRIDLRNKLRSAYRDRSEATERAGRLKIELATLKTKMYDILAEIHPVG